VARPDRVPDRPNDRRPEPAKEESVAEDDESGAETRSMGRTMALSDGIFAIAMTLLAFQIEPPDLHGAQVHHLGRALADLSTQYWVYVLSFAVIALYWIAHRRLFRFLTRADEVFTRANLVFLMAIAALPFPSAVMGRYGSQRAAVILYAAAISVTATLETVLWLLADRRHLLSPATGPADVRDGVVRGGTAAMVFALSIPIAFVDPKIAPFVWISFLFVRLVLRRTGVLHGL
jgi:uncharacterized membrane protein